MKKSLRRFFCLVGNYMPPKLNCYFYKLAGVKFNISKVWIGNKCYLDTMFPEQIIINDEVCISSHVKIITHFDPSKSIKNHKVKKYKKQVVLENGVFIGPGSVILPGVKLRYNSFIKAGSVIKKSTKENSIIEGNPQKVIGNLSDKVANRINLLNKNYNF
tara:strand:- start:364 stop:843 length:480 start_codon:yes stop_codon:yes gene_type:complete